MPRYSRRLFLKLTAAVGAQLAVLGSGAAYARWCEPNWLDVERVSIPLAVRQQPAGLDGLRLAQLSDLHAGHDLPPDRLEAALQLVMDLSPDLLVITGDWVTFDAADALPAAQIIARWSPPLGIYAVLGNHDHWTDAELVADGIQSAGITLLRNSHVRIPAGGDSLWLAGVDDIWEQRHDLEAALAGIPAGAPTILLAHEPDYADVVAASGRVALQLSGHSHGGQVHLPGVGSPVVPHLGQKYVRGLYRVGETMWQYTNRGIGTVRPGVRFNCRPEITLITFYCQTLLNHE